MKHVNIHPSGTPKDNQGEAAGHDLRQTPKNYGKRRMVGVIRGGKYVNPETGEEIKFARKFKGMPGINKIGGVE